MTQTKEEVKKDVEMKQKCCDSKLKRKETVYLNKQVVGKFGRGPVKCKDLKGANVKEGMKNAT